MKSNEDSKKVLTRQERQCIISAMAVLSTFFERMRDDIGEEGYVAWAEMCMLIKNFLTVEDLDFDAGDEADIRAAAMALTVLEENLSRSRNKDPGEVETVLVSLEDLRLLLHLFIPDFADEYENLVWMR